MAAAEGPLDYTAKDYEALREALLELARERLPEWTDHSANDLGVVLVELFAGMGDVLAYYQDRIAQESYLHTARERRSVLHLLRLIGYELTPAKPASADLTLLFDAEADPEQKVEIPVGARFETDGEATGEPIGFAYVADQPLSIVLGELEDLEERDGELVRVYGTLPVIQVDALREDVVIGSSDGDRGQRYALPHRVIDKTLRIEVDEGGASTVWERRGSLLSSRGDDRHYSIRRDEHDQAWVEFGDGTYGRRPPRGRDNVTASYWIGGGEKGNVAPGTITGEVTELDHLMGLVNERAASGGAEAEPIEQAARRGPEQFRSANRAVTASDFEFHARQFGVGKVRARAGAWNRVELYVAPAGGGYPSDTLKNDLRTSLAGKRMLTTAVVVLDPTYVPVEIRGELHVRPNYFADEVKQRVRNAVRSLLRFAAVDFGATLYLSKFYEAAEGVDGVAGIHIDRFRRADQREDLPPAGKLTFGGSELPEAAHPEGIDLTRVRGGQHAG